jgi:hypothetical protein
MDDLVKQTADLNARALELVGAVEEDARRALECRDLEKLAAVLRGDVTLLRALADDLVEAEPRVPPTTNETTEFRELVDRPAGEE